MSQRAFYGNRNDPTQARKIVHRWLAPRTVHMRHVTRRAQRMQKHKFSITSLDALFIEPKPELPKHEKKCINVWPNGRTGRHYMTR
jgi:hypothetical protein